MRSTQTSVVSRGLPWAGFKETHRMIETILDRRFSLLRHKQAPLFEERERFLAQLHQQGTSRKSLRNMAGELIQVIRLLRLEKLRDVDLQEIDRASRIWAQEQRSNPKARTYVRSVSYFAYVAK